MTIVLIHGAWHGAWCWYKVAPALERYGHRVLAPDLPGHGNDRTPAGDIGFQRNVETITAVLRSCGSPVMLVGHSLAGMFISQAAEAVPESVARLVYVSAFLPRSGQSVLDLVGADSAVTANAMPSPDGRSSTLRPESLDRLFYGDCDPAVAAVAKDLVVPEPLAPFATPAELTSERFGRIPRAYIQCLGDEAIRPDRQKAMFTATPCDPVVAIDTGHSPFLADPNGLARILHRIAAL